MYLLFLASFFSVLLLSNSTIFHTFLSGTQSTYILFLSHSTSIITQFQPLFKTEVSRSRDSSTSSLSQQKFARYNHSPTTSNLKSACGWIQSYLFIHYFSPTLNNLSNLRLYCPNTGVASIVLR
ncbi:hypothetical protein DL98DRAFT_281146 [Cadophora sp. DSE1049]|nr:hypothetical protein DL98DRAFT_281146 [Cadophora sp. DSE1049]